MSYRTRLDRLEGRQPQAQVSLWDVIAGAADPTELSGYHAELWARLVEIEASGPGEDPIAQRLRECVPNP